ncbi:MAG: VOC family protein [Lachnospiraceae bacterium]|nr:VOC family protein [Lachnospiraceae bacterium]MBQ8947907.1 VOC family protein [Lachnospiraceae bacterium]
MISTLKIHHIGYLVKKIEKAQSQFLTLGYQVVSKICRDEYRKVDILFMEKDGYRIELVSPYSEDSVVYGLMSRYKNSPYHICYETDDLETTAAELCSDGFTAIDEATPAPAIKGRRVQFLMGRYSGMIELLEN